MKNLSLVLLFILSTVIPTYLYAGVTVEQVRGDSNYIYGEGVAETTLKANRQALDGLMSQICAAVEVSDGADLPFSSVVKSYANATLANSSQLIIENEPNAQLMRYMLRADISKIFDARKFKVENMLQEAQRSLTNGNINDALRYYYWAHMLIKSLPNPDDVMVKDARGAEHVANLWIPTVINDIFKDLEITATNNGDDGVQLSITYNGRKVNGIDYSYLDGELWSDIYSAQDGVGLIDATDKRSVKIKVEYIFENESVVDPEIRELLQLLPNTIYKGAYKSVKIAAARALEPSKPLNSFDDLAVVGGDERYRGVIDTIISAVKSGSAISNVEQIFTPTGLDAYNRLIKYGSARVVDCSQPKFYEFSGVTYCRDILMNFSFKNNRRVFMENVVFKFSEDGRVDNITFGLSRQAAAEIFQKQVWSEQARVILIHFLEGYKTAYALKQLDYIESIFDDDALIITGSCVRRATHTEMQLIHTPAVKYTRHKKSEYLRRLRYIFAANEFINIKFADNRIMKAGRGGEIYGIEIKQEYHSSSYGDTGYLFLMIDLNNALKPIIHVRTWQPEKDPEFGVYGLRNF